MTTPQRYKAGAAEVGRVGAIAAFPATKRRSLDFAEAVAGYGLVAPGLILLMGLVLLPVVGVIVLSLSSWSLGSRDFRIIGVANYIEIFSDPTFRKSLLNTLFYVAVVIPVTTGLALLVAIAIESQSHFRAFFRTVHFIPVMATLAAMAIAWEAMLHPSIGLINQALALVGIEGRNWLRDETLVLPTLMMIGIWQHLGLAMVLFLAGLKSIPADLYEAASIDGADSGLDRFLTVTWPLLGPVVMFVTIIIALKAFEVFDTVNILTKGGPLNASEVLLHTLYVESFQYLRTGYGAAVTVVFLLIMVVLTLTQARVFDRRVHYS